MATIPAHQLRESKYLTFVIGQTTADSQPVFDPLLLDPPQERYVGPLHHPGKEDPAAWRPGNDAASEYTALRVLWENFSAQLAMARKDSNSFTRRLTLKAAVVELRSFFDAVPRFGALVAKVPPHDGVLPRAFVCLTEQEREHFHKRSKALNEAKKGLLKTLNRLRNNVGAHMSRPLLRGSADAGTAETLTWAELGELWNLLEPRMLMETARAGDAFLRAAVHLPIYEFYRHESPTTIRFHVPAIAVEDGPEMRFTALSSSLVKQIELLDSTLVEGGAIVFRRDPLRLRIGWPDDMRARFPFLPDTVEV